MNASGTPGPTTAIDTNVLVRILVADDPAQTKRALAVVERGPVWIPRTVLLETVWILSRAYGIEGSRLQHLVAGILALDRVALESRSEVEQAIAWWRDGLDFADALHLASSVSAESFATFDRTLARGSKRIPTRPVVEAI